MLKFSLKRPRRSIFLETLWVNEVWNEADRSFFVSKDLTFRSLPFRFVWLLDFKDLFERTDGQTDGFFYRSTSPNVRMLRFPRAERKINWNYKIRIFGAGLLNIKVFMDYFFFLFLWPGTGSETLRPSSWKPPGSLRHRLFCQAPVFLTFWEKKLAWNWNQSSEMRNKCWTTRPELRQIKRKGLFRRFAASLFCSETERRTFSLPPQTFIDHIQSSVFTPEVCVPTVGARNETVSSLSHRFIDSFPPDSAAALVNQCTYWFLDVPIRKWCSDIKRHESFRGNWQMFGLKSLLKD